MPVSTEKLLGKIIGHCIALRRNPNDKKEYRLKQIRFYTKIVDRREALKPKNVTRKTVKEAVIIAYDELPLGIFSGNEFCKRVKHILNRVPYQDSILRELRRFRSAGIINFESIDNKKKSLYNKIK